MERKFDSEPMAIAGPSNRVAQKRRTLPIVEDKKKLAGNSAADSNKKKPRPTETKSNPIHIFSGSIPQIIQAHKCNPPINIIYETFGRIISVTTPGRFACEQIVLLRDLNGQTVIQGVFYEIDLSLSPACRRTNQIVRCVGKFSYQGRFKIIKIGPTDDDFIQSMNRLNSFSNFAILRT